MATHPLLGRPNDPSQPHPSSPHNSFLDLGVFSQPRFLLQVGSRLQHSHPRRLVQRRNSELTVMDVVGEEAPIGHPRYTHIKKRSLKNKSLNITFNEKELRDYVTGFHKRKKKRRKEARQKQEKTERRKRIELRKKRKIEKEFALYGGPLSERTEDGEEEEDNEQDEGSEQDEETDQIPSVSGTTLYDNGDYKVTVTTSEITQEEEDEQRASVAATTTATTATTTGSNVKPKTKQSIPVSKKKTFKKVVNKRSRPKLVNKRDKRMGKKGKSNKKKR